MWPKRLWEDDFVASPEKRTCARRRANWRDLLFGKRLDKCDERMLIEQIGLVFQDPDNQIVMDEVMQEIIFGLENLGYSNFEMRKRVAEMVHFFGMEELLRLKPSELSGGQKQMLNLLSVAFVKA